MKSTQKGFTLIELMIVIAIIAILAAIAIPAYSNYLVRSQVSEGFTLMDGAKVAVTEYYANTGHYPPSAQSAGLPAAATSTNGQYVTQVALTADSGVITATFGNDANDNINGETVTLTPDDTQGNNLVWTCGGDVDTKYLPSSCR